MIALEHLTRTLPGLNHRYFSAASDDETMAGDDDDYLLATSQSPPAPPAPPSSGIIDRDNINISPAITLHLHQYAVQSPLPTQPDVFQSALNACAFIDISIMSTDGEDDGDGES